MAKSPLLFTPEWPQASEEEKQAYQDYLEHIDEQAQIRQQSLLPKEANGEEYTKQGTPTKHGQETQ